MIMPGNITFSDIPGAGSGFVNIAGARNGLSLDTTNHVVLGQDLAAAGNPAQLTSRREIPQELWSINLFGGPVAITDTAMTPASTDKLYLHSAVANGTTLIHGQATVANGQNFTLLNLGDSAAPSTFVFGVGIGIGQTNSTKTGLIIMGDPLTGHTAINIDTSSYINTVPAGQGTIKQIFQPSYQTLTGSLNYIAISDQSIVLSLGSGSNIFSSFQSNIGASIISANDEIIGFWFKSVTTALSGKITAVKTEQGNVLLCTDIVSATAGRVGVRGVTTPSAWLHLGAGAAAAGSAPLKFTSGTLLTTSEVGTMEFNGSNFFANRGAGRETLLTGVSGSSAPATNTGTLPTTVFGSLTDLLGGPTSWAAVSINGTVFKIPLYT